MRWRRTCGLLVLAAFMLCGGLRLALAISAIAQLPDQPSENSLYEGVVLESSPRVKTLALLRPDAVKGMRVLFSSDAPLEISQRVKVLGKMRPLVASFKNPGSVSWKWLKRLEGVGWELRGKVVSAGRGHDPIVALRRYFANNIKASGAPRTDVILALTIGDRSGVSQGTHDLFLRTGAIHVLVINGFKLSIISGFFFFIVRFCFRRVRRFRLSGQDARYAALVAIPFPILFMLVAGSGLPLIRATIMVVVLMASFFLQRKMHFYNALALAALIILVIYPHSLLTASFQLTFTSVLFIVVCMGRLMPLLNKIRSGALKWSCSVVLSTAAATVGSAPVVLYYFFGISAFPLLSNLISVPLMGVGATGLGLLGMLHPCGRLLLVAAGYLAQANLAVLHALDFGYLFPLVRPCLTETLLYYCLLLALFFINRKGVALLLFCVVLPLSAIQVYADYRDRFNDDLRVNFIDVGQGDSALIEAPGGMRILIDGGGFPGSDFDMGKQVVAPFLLYRKVLTVDYVINTHPHADHISGLVYIVQHFKVRHVVTGGVFPAERKFLQLTDSARMRGVERLIWKRGDGIRTTNFRMDTLYPAGKLPLDNLNETSLVFRLQHGQTAFVLPADITADVERQLVLSGVPLRADVLKLPHHGSGSSNTFAFIHAVRPKLGIVSAAEGTIKNLPSPEALLRYRSLSIPLLRTDRQGLIEVRSDGSAITWKTHESPSASPAIVFPFSIPFLSESFSSLPPPLSSSAGLFPARPF